MKIYNTTESLKKIIDQMELHDRVFFTRYGDNDIMMMSGTDPYGQPLGKKRYGGNRTLWTPALQEELLYSFKINDPRYLKGVSGAWAKEAGMRKGVFESFGYKHRLEQMISMFTGEETFLIPILFHYLITFRIDLFEFFINKFIKGKKILFIGSVEPKYLKPIIGDVAYHVKTPQTGAYESIDKWWGGVEDVIDDVDVVLPNCGQASRVIQGRLWKMKKNVHSIDLGSIFDPLAMRNSRTCWKLEGWRLRRHYGEIR